MRITTILAALLTFGVAVSPASADTTLKRAVPAAAQPAASAPAPAEQYRSRFGNRGWRGGYGYRRGWRGGYRPGYRYGWQNRYRPVWRGGYRPRYNYYNRYRPYRLHNGWRRGWRHR